MSGLFLGRGSACNWCGDVSSSPSESSPSVSSSVSSSLSSSVSVSSVSFSIFDANVCCDILPRVWRVTVIGAYALNADFQKFDIGGTFTCRHFLLCDSANPQVSWLSDELKTQGQAVICGADMGGAVDRACLLQLTAAGSPAVCSWGFALPLLTAQKPFDADDCLARNDASIFTPGRGSAPTSTSPFRYGWESDAQVYWEPA